MADNKKPKENYVDNEVFYQAMKEYKEKCQKAEKEGKEKPPIPNYIGECFMKIAEGLSHIHKFINYPFRDEMISDGIENCIMYMDNFDPVKYTNPFAYFTQIIYYAFLRRIQKEKKQLYIRYKATQQKGILDEHEMMELGDGTNVQFEMYDNISEFIENFEEAKRVKKEKVNKPKGVEKFLEE
jgi:hypothetical protein